MISSIALRFVYPMVSLEGEAFWKIRSAPVRLNKVAMLKFGIALTLSLIIGETLNGFSKPLRVASTLFTSTSVNAAFITLAMVALCFGMGSLFASYKEKNPIRVASSQGASLTFLISLMYLVFLVAVLFFPINNYFESQVRLISDGQARILPDGQSIHLPNAEANLLFFASTVIIGVVSLFIASISWAISVRALRRDF